MTDALKKNLVESYYKFDIKKYEKLLENAKEDFWQKESEKRVLNLFHQAAVHVPAYKDFLKKNKIDSKKIKTINDFRLVPKTDKKNYIQNYALSQRAWGGSLKGYKLTASSSGTTANANNWPRMGTQEIDAAINHELIYRNFFKIEKKESLLIIGFPMGVYVSGVATLLPTWLVAQKYELNIVSAGNSKTEVLKAVKNLSRNYAQTILVGHPFFIKDVIETGKKEGIKWDDLKLKIMLCSEGFNEAWREYLLREAGIKNKYSSCISTYGSSEMLLMANETPMSIKIKELVEKNPAINLKLFDRRHTPNIFQFNPVRHYIEAESRELIFTAQSGLPLIRFNLHDSGVVFSFEEGKKLLNEFVPNWQNKQLPPIWQLPFVALWGRSDHTIIFYAANIYPDHIHAALNKKQFLKYITGKFSLRKGYFKNMDEFLEVNIELKINTRIPKHLAKIIQAHLVEKLKAINMEYLFLCNHLDKNLTPRIKLWSYQHPKYFKAGLKPKYIA